MGRIFVKGDCHGNFTFLKLWCKNNNTTKEDYLVLCGDVGINYYLNKKDKDLKEKISKCPITLICVHGNHEERPKNIPSYKFEYNEDLKCNVWYEERYPNIIFPQDGVVEILGHKCLILGGAYSIDKYYRIYRHLTWFPEEQMSEEDKERIFKILEKENSFEYIFSHTVPLIYERELVDLFLPVINQYEVDKSMEEFLSEVEDRITYKHWFFGHFHDSFDLTEKVTILYHNIVELKIG